MGKMLSIIIPTYNEQDTISALITYLIYSSKDFIEIIVCDGGSTDQTILLAEQAGAKAILSPHKGRAAQMNYGASIAKGNIYYFIHADSLPPPTFIKDIQESILGGYSFGRYRTKFDSKKHILKLNAFFTRMDLFMCYGGDQTLFITKELFLKIEGFNRNMLIMEDYEIIERAKQHGRYKIFNKPVLISARKYERNSWLKVQIANYTIVKMYKKGASQDDMIEKYKQLLNYR